MRHLLKQMAYLVFIGLLLGAFDIGSDVAWAAIQEFYDGEGEPSVAIYSVIACAGIIWLGCEIFQLYSKYMTMYAGKPLLEKYQKELEEDWKNRRGASLEQTHLENDELRAKVKRLTSDLHKSRVTCINAENTLNQAMEELKVLRGPLELNSAGTGQHFDDWAIDHFVVQMRAAMKRGRDDGKGYWYDKDLCGDEALRTSAEEKLLANRNIDAANYLMMLWVRDAYAEECLKEADKPE